MRIGQSRLRPLGIETLRADELFVTARLVSCRNDRAGESGNEIEVWPQGGALAQKAPKANRKLVGAVFLLLGSPTFHR